jgi:hypothetical protein
VPPTATCAKSGLSAELRGAATTRHAEHVGTLSHEHIEPAASVRLWKLRDPGMPRALNNATIAALIATTGSAWGPIGRSSRRSESINDWSLPCGIVVAQRCRTMHAKLVLDQFPCRRRVERSGCRPVNLGNAL